MFGEGQRASDIMLVGEQPGDKEDLAGRPFVGPAGRLLDDALADAGIDRSKVYVTNVVKHFKWEERGKRRIHKKPNMAEITACKPWLEAELAVVKPRVVVLLGATAAQALLGRQFRVTKERGRFVDSELAPLVTATIHPSAILRAPDDATRKEEFAAFTEDLALVARPHATHRFRCQSYSSRATARVKFPRVVTSTPADRAAAVKSRSTCETNARMAAGATSSERAIERSAIRASRPPSRSAIATSNDPARRLSSIPAGATLSISAPAADNSCSTRAATIRSLLTSSTRTDTPFEPRG
jgi:DNA polymerase